MTNRQKLEIERSTKVQRLNALLDLEGAALTDELRAEMDAITTRMPGLEVEMRGAITAEAAEEAEARGMFGNNGDGEAAEVRQLLDRTTLTDYCGPASAGIGIEGRAAELNAALKVPTAGAKGGPAVPWELLEVRAFTTTAANDGPEMQRPILQRLFGPGVMDTLGVRLDTVPAGRSEWPIVTGGVAPAQAKEGDAAAAAVTAVFSYANLKPKRLTGRYEGSVASLATGRCVIRGLPVHLMILRWPDGPVAMPWPRSGRTVRDRRRARRSGPRRQCRPGGRTSRPGPCAARASPRSP